eukprot:SAG11_NODE_266_length_11468_cov_11.519222_2_plen_75_part_00
MMTVFTGKDGRVMKRARQNTNIGTVKARLISSLGDEIRSSPSSPAAVVYRPRDPVRSQGVAIYIILNAIISVSS